MGDRSSSDGDPEVTAGKSDPRPGSLPRWYSFWRLGALLWVGALVLLIAATVGGDLARGGVRPCDRLDDRICLDLGPDDCRVWQTRLARAGAASTQPHQRRWNRPGRAVVDAALHVVLRWDGSTADNPSCYAQLRDDVYPIILSAVRTMLAAPRP